MKIMNALSLCIFQSILVLSFLDGQFLIAAMHGSNLVRGETMYYRQSDSQAENSRNSKHVSGTCHIPSKWKGKWFQSGVQLPIVIDSKGITTKGNCSESQGDKFLFMESNGYGGNCYRCIVINDRHMNVLQYKETQYCEDKDSLENLCSQITGDAQLYSLFRIDAPLEECPFKGAPFTFTYNRGYGECKYPVSHVDSCTDGNRLLLRYQACPDVLKTESLQEELHCIAQWREGPQHYAVGKVHHRLSASASNEDSYRCFAYERIKGHNREGSHPGIAGFKVAQSGDATCTGVTSSHEGARTMTFTRVEHAESKCKFPSWLVSHHWHTLNGKFTAKFHHSNTSFHVTEDTRKNSTSQHLVNEHSSYNSGTSNELFVGGSKIFCQTRRDIPGHHVTSDRVIISARHVNGCKTKTVCLEFFKRTSHTVEFQIRPKEDGESECETRGPTSTLRQLVTTEPALHRCPYLGKYTATDVTDGRGVRDGCGLNGGQNAFNTLFVGCGDRTRMDFHSKCESQSFSCHGHWEEDGLGFLIGTPVSRSSTSAHAHCFVYTEMAEGGLRVYSSSEQCRRNASLARDQQLMSGVEGTWAFNLTSDGQCAEAVTAGAASITCDTSHHFGILCHTTLLLIVALLSKTLVNRIPSSIETLVDSSSLSPSALSHISNSTTTTTTSNLIHNNNYPNVLSSHHSESLDAPSPLLHRL